jgi:hypothetical protein
MRRALVGADDVAIGTALVRVHHPLDGAIAVAPPALDGAIALADLPGERVDVLVVVGMRPVQEMVGTIGEDRADLPLLVGAQSDVPAHVAGVARRVLIGAVVQTGVGHRRGWTVNYAAVGGPVDPGAQRGTADEKAGRQDQ